MTDATRAPLADRRILVAEDEFLSRMLLEDMLAELSAVVVGSVATEDALAEALREHAPDAVTLDLNLRGRRSYDAALALKERGIPFVIVTGYDRLPDCPPSLDEVPRVAKPVAIDDLRVALTRAIAQRLAR
jgi:CheY-like chemotaxis protein